MLNRSLISRQACVEFTLLYAWPIVVVVIIINNIIGHYLLVFLHTIAGCTDNGSGIIASQLIG